MMPILYEKDETAFVSNGLCRLRDAISLLVTEERNSIFECELQYPVTGANFEKIQVGRIIAVTHDDTGTVEPFDIVSFTRPIEGVVTFHCVHISYRQSYMTVTGSNINSLAAAFALLSTAEPSNPFNYQTDKASNAYMAAADGTPRSVRQLLGGVEGSILDAYGGEYEWTRWTVYLHSARGQVRDFAIRYGVNMISYDEEYSTEETYSSCIPYWTDGTTTVVGDRVDGPVPTITGRGECVPLDVSDRFENTPTKAQVEAEALSYLRNQNTALPQQTIDVKFARLQDLGMEDFGALTTCRLCDTIKVIFPGNTGTGSFKIVKTVWDALRDRYDEMELGQLSTTLAEALGSGEGGLNSGGAGDYNDLTSKPQINGVTLTGNKSWGDLGLAGGHQSVGTISANSYKDVTITHNLGANTRVVATLYSSGTAVNIGNTAVVIADITDTQATIRIFNNRSSTITPYVDWIAIKA